MPYQNQTFDKIWLVSTSCEQVKKSTWSQKVLSQHEEVRSRLQEAVCTQSHAKIGIIFEL